MRALNRLLVRENQIKRSREGVSERKLSGLFVWTMFTRIAVATAAAAILFVFAQSPDCNKN
jgi:hypothetical protein